MAAPIKLISCVGTISDLPLIPHFVMHYSEIGIATSDMHFILQSWEDETPGLLAAEEMLGRIGAASPARWIAPYTSEEMWQQRRDLQRELASPGLWILNADLDEHYLFPASLEEIIEESELHDVNCVQGLQVDRLSIDGSLAPVAEAPSLSRQFPVSADVSLYLFGDRSEARLSASTKMMLHRADVFPRRGGHNPNEEGAPVRFLVGQPLAKFSRLHDPFERFRFPFRSHHYKWIETRGAATQRRITTPGVSPAGLQQGQKVLDYLDRHTRIRLEDVAVAPKVAPCSLDWRQRLQAMREEASNPEAPYIGVNGKRTVHVVLRSAGERTEAVAGDLAARQAGAGSVTTIREVPFAKALHKGFEAGIRANCKWTLCLDADVLLGSGSLTTLLSAAEEADRDQSPLFEIEGNVADKLLGHWRNAGQHLYRTELLPKALEIGEFDPSFRRPETQLKKRMAQHGYPWTRVDARMGLHDYEQSYVDIFRTVYTHTRKFARHMPAAEHYWRRRAAEDTDFAVALFTLTLAQEINDWKGPQDIPEGKNVTIDRRAFPANLDAILTSAGLSEKPALDRRAIGQDWVDRELASFTEATEFAPPDREQSSRLAGLLEALRHRLDALLPSSR